MPHEMLAYSQGAVLLLMLELCHLCLSPAPDTRDHWLHVQALMAALEEAADQAGARLKPLDKKGEKAALQAERQALEQQLRASEDAATGLSLAASLLVHRVSAVAASDDSLCLKHRGWLSNAVCR